MAPFVTRGRSEGKAGPTGMSDPPANRRGSLMPIRAAGLGAAVRAPFQAPSFGSIRSEIARPAEPSDAAGSQAAGPRFKSECRLHSPLAIARVLRSLSRTVRSHQTRRSGKSGDPARSHGQRTLDPLQEPADQLLWHRPGAVGARGRHIEAADHPGGCGGRGGCFLRRGVEGPSAATCAGVDRFTDLPEGPLLDQLDGDRVPGVVLARPD
jgi:hypothetical protein